MTHSRRQFLRLAGGTVLTLGAAQEASAGLFETNAKERSELRIGYIGVGGQGKNNLNYLKGQTVAVCDVDSARLAKAQVDVEKTNGKPCAAYADFRRLLDDKNVDAVVITTPDHWHAAMTILACEAGKDVYCEKPLTLTVAEGRAMTRTARRTKKIVQTGSQQRSDARFRWACEAVRAGKIGKVTKVEVGIPGVNFVGPGVPDSAPPPELNYDLWLGPAPQRPYNTKRVHYNFRFFWDYSGGQQTNWGAHRLDIVQWGLGYDDGCSLTVTGEARYNKDNWYEVPEWSKLTYTYPEGVIVSAGQDYLDGMTFFGEKGKIGVNRGSLTAPPELLNGFTFPTGKEGDMSYLHFQNWLDCILTRKNPVADVEIGHRSATVCHLGNIAIRSGKTIAWDSKREKIVGEKEAAAMLSRPYREPWKLG